MWSSVQGGTYIVDTSTDLFTWVDLSPSVTATGIASQSTEAAAAQTYSQRFYKVKLSSIASFDP
jgi:pyridoxine/pyridoxamine 5'-phosphate oxidase